MATAGITDSIGWRSRIQPWLCLLPSAIGLGLALVSSPAIRVGSWAQFHVESLAWLSFVFGAALRWWGALYLGSAPSNSLVTSGPYSICRNPMQVGNLLLGSSLVLYLGSATFAVGFAVGASACFSLIVAGEEQRLTRSFGTDYRYYCQRVSRLWIRPGLFQSTETLFVDAGSLFSELRLTALWMWLPVIGKVLSQLRGEIWWPHWIGLP